MTVEVCANPLIMVIEDDEESLKAKKKGFELRGCSVIGFSHSDEALKNVFTSPSIDLIFTDISLDSSGNVSGFDKSGVAFARLIKELEIESPMGGYSTKFEDGDLTDSERAYFDYWYDRGDLSKNINAMFDELATVAIDHRRLKCTKAEDLMNNLRDKYSLRPEECEQVRELVLKSDGPNDIERILYDANYSIRIVHPSNINSLAKPILIWIKKCDGGVIEAEVYGHSSLYSFGNSEKEAIVKLIELMHLFNEDLVDESANYQGAALRLREFLHFVIKQS